MKTDQRRPLSPVDTELQTLGCRHSNSDICKNNSTEGKCAFVSCFDQASRAAVQQQFTRSFLNPPFSQEGEPEFQFLNAAMDALEPGGILAAVVYAGIFADADHSNWRREFLRRHSLLAMISLPEDLFYPTAAPTSIIVALGHVAQSDERSVLMARIWNDGFEKLKNKRVERAGSQLPTIKEAFDSFLAGNEIVTNLATTIRGGAVKDGEEWSPQQWLPQPLISDTEVSGLKQSVAISIFRAVSILPELSEEVLDDFGTSWPRDEDLPLGETAPVSYFFDVENGKSTGEKNYLEGAIPYVSSGDTSNSIVRLVERVDEECFEGGGITVTAFGTAAVQPWSFMARGNGGSAVRVLIPKFNMTFQEMLWFAAQINMQRWRFFYARMAIKSRLKKLEIASPPNRIPDIGENIEARVRAFRTTIEEFSEVA